ncbi:MAG TPA: hypothetical protein V6C81_24495 [Planktothrix sp.]|jgi:hypothetical protein
MADANKRTEVSSAGLYLQAVEDVPRASVNFAQEAWAHKTDTMAHIIKEGLSSYLFGGLIGYVVPAKGPAAAITGIALSAPMLINGVKRLAEASHDLHQHKASSDVIAQGLARDSVDSGFDLAIDLAGGYWGAKNGTALAKSEKYGAPARALHQKIAIGENETLLLMRNGFDKLSATWSRSPVTESSSAVAQPDFVSAKSSGIADGRLEDKLGVASGAQSATATKKPVNLGYVPKSYFGRLNARMNQYSLMTREAPAVVSSQPELISVFGSTHGHSRYSDGMGLPIDLYKQAIAEGQQVTAITDHNHLAARGGVKPDDPRAADQTKAPVVAADPIEYAQTQQDAAATTIPGKHVSLYGIEVGTIGSEPHGHGGEGGGGHAHGGEGEEGSSEPPEGDAKSAKQAPADGDATTTSASKIIGPEPPDSLFEQPAAGAPKLFVPRDFKAAQLESLSPEHLGGPSGVNHINLLEVPTFFEAVRQPKKGFSALFSRLTFGAMTELKAPDVIKINDGDYKSLVAHLQNMKDSTGNTPVITLNHPRFMADKSPSLPDALRNRDYGRKSFANDDEWRQQFVLPFVRVIELIKGGALTPHPVDEVPAGNIDVASYVGYLGLGVEAGPGFGRDFHYGNPVGNPGATQFLVTSLDKPEVLDSMRQRRTAATTNGVKLNGYLMANDKFYMGSILDQSAVPQLNLKMKIGGEIDANAQYTVKLFGDDQVLDGKDAAVIQTKQVSGQELLSSNGEVAFDPITHKAGNNSLYFVEAARVEQGAAAISPIRMWTSPIWVRPLAGDSHGMLTRFAAGTAAQWPVLQNVAPLPGAH